MRRSRDAHRARTRGAGTRPTATNLCITHSRGELNFPSLSSGLRPWRPPLPGVRAESRHESRVVEARLDRDR